jgi:ring-1,2-phenylacetyl-CoA epoxidase subunit PaaE
MALKYHSLKVKDVVRETSDTISLHFKQPLFKKIAYQAGQFLTLIIEHQGKKYRRSYSLSSTPNLDDPLVVTIKRVEGGVVSNWLNDNVRTGDKIELVEPMGNFTLVPQASKAQHYLFFAAGSGITPIISMLKGVLHFEKNSRVHLFYSSRTPQDIIFKKTLDELQSKFGDALTVTHFISQNPEAGQEGRLSEARLEELLGSLPQDLKREAYLCGPLELMQSIEGVLQKVGVTEVFKENFFAPPPADDGASIAGQSVRILLSGIEHQVDVQGNKSILDAALDEAIDMPYSCQAGLCTACRGKCTSGKVKMDSNDALSDEEIAAGYVLTCQARPLTDDVVIDMDAQ